MNRGAIAMIDALGFKGIWGRNQKKPSTAVLDTLRAVQKAGKERAVRFAAQLTPAGMPNGFDDLVRDLEVDARCLSDTVVISTSPSTQVPAAVDRRTEPPCWRVERKVACHRAVALVLLLSGCRGACDRRSAGHGNIGESPEATERIDLTCARTRGSGFCSLEAPREGSPERMVIEYRGANAVFIEWVAVDETGGVWRAQETDMPKEWFLVGRLDPGLTARVQSLIGKSLAAPLREESHPYIADLTGGAIEAIVDGGPAPLLTVGPQVNSRRDSPATNVLADFVIDLQQASKQVALPRMKFRRLK